MKPWMKFVLILTAVSFWPITLVLGVAWLVFRLVLIIMKSNYFKSARFLEIRNEIQSVVAEHNEISNYVEEIRNGGQFTIGHSSTGTQAHLATSTNTSKFAYKRDRNIADFGSKYVHNASLQVVRNASAEPIKYLMKYFDIPSTEEKLVEVEALGEAMSRLENAVSNLHEREESISTTVSPPKFIKKYFLKEFQEQVGLSVPPLGIPYPVYQFQFVSAGGNSSQVTTVKLDSSAIEALMGTMMEKIKFKKSAAGQRALMTANFRNYIKKRDNFTCLSCSVSTRDEEHLLLEVDHIIPVSKGGTSTEGNLQTLCWRCNRTKSNKIISSDSSVSD